jgi:glycerol-3-phosphate cytidylyltransferase
MSNIYAIGVFDIFHIGHLNHLLTAKKFGDNLIVGICSDDLVLSTKRSPIISQEHRVEIISQLKCVDSAFIYTDLNQIKKLKKLKISTFCIGPEYDSNPHYTETVKFCKEQNINIKVIKRTKDVSTTNIIRRCLAHKSNLEATSYKFWNSLPTYPKYNAPIGLRRDYEVKYLLPKLKDVTSILDLACGDGTLITRLAEKTEIKELYAYDFSETLIKNITNPLIKTRIYNVLKDNISLPVTDIIICAGLLPFIFSDKEVIKVLDKIKSQKLFLRTPCSMSNDNILVDKFSTDLNNNYASLYRTVDQVEKLLSEFFTVENIIRIYPDSIESQYDTKQFYFECTKK